MDRFNVVTKPARMGLISPACSHDQSRLPIVLQGCTYCACRECGSQLRHHWTRIRVTVPPTVWPAPHLLPAMGETYGRVR
jgi:hypothetical protein